MKQGFYHVLWGERERAPPWEFNAPAVCLSVSLSIYIYIYIYISYVRHFWSRGPRATRKRKPAHLKLRSHACMLYNIIGASVSESHLGSSTRPLSVSLSVCLSIYIREYGSTLISYVRHFWSRGPRATRKRKPAHLKFKGHMHACCIILYVANASRAITTLIERLHMYSSSLITSSAG